MFHPSILKAVLGIIILSACGSGARQETTDSTLTANIDAPGNNSSTGKVVGSYQGTLPCADCPGIDLQLSLYGDHHYKQLMVYRERNDNQAMVDTGSWQLEHDTIVRLTGKKDEQGQQFLLADGKLYQLDKAGQRVTGALADNFILRPVEGGGDRTRMQAKAAAGIEFLAAGNEPFWTLELDHQKTIYFHTANGDSLRLPVPRPKPDTDTLKVYMTKNEKTEFTLTIHSRACTDDMTGFMRPYKVEVQMNDRMYMGCGEYLIQY